MTTLDSRISRTEALRIFAGRSLLHSRRDMETLITSITLPAVLMALFTYVFGGAIDPTGKYVDYVVPGIILLTAGFGASSTAVSVARDASSGLIDRLRTMPLPHGTVIAGHVVSSVARNLLSTAVVIGVALAMGFRPAATWAEWMGAMAIVMAYVLVVTYLFAAIGVLAGSPEAASGYGFILLFLPYLSSAFVPVETMPGWLQAFARHQPITPITESVRGLLLGGAVPWTAALAWCAVLLLLGGGLASWAFRRRLRPA